MKVVKTLIGILVALILIAVIGALCFYNYGIKPYDKNNKEIIKIGGFINGKIIF